MQAFYGGFPYHHFIFQEIWLLPPPYFFCSLLMSIIIYFLFYYVYFILYLFIDLLISLLTCKLLKGRDCLGQFVLVNPRLPAQYLAHKRYPTIKPPPPLVFFLSLSKSMPSLITQLLSLAICHIVITIACPPHPVLPF